MKLFAHSLLDELASRATAAPRRRSHHTIHGSAEDPVQRFFVTANPDSYFRPHRHLNRSELAVVVRGRFDVLTFDEAGLVTARHEFGEGVANLAYETPRGTWHTVVSLADGSTFLEIKEGPYDPVTAAEFAPWSPAEGSAGVAEFMHWLHEARPGDRAPAEPRGAR